MQAQVRDLKPMALERGERMVLTFFMTRKIILVLQSTLHCKSLLCHPGWGALRCKITRLKPIDLGDQKTDDRLIDQGD